MTIIKTFTLAKTKITNSKSLIKSLHTIGKFLCKKFSFNPSICLVQLGLLFLSEIRGYLRAPLLLCPQSRNALRTVLGCTLIFEDFSMQSANFEDLIFRFLLTSFIMEITSCQESFLGRPDRGIFSVLFVLL